MVTSWGPGEGRPEGTSGLDTLKGQAHGARLNVHRAWPFPARPSLPTLPEKLA